MKVFTWGRCCWISIEAWKCDDDDDEKSSDVGQKDQKQGWMVGLDCIGIRTSAPPADMRHGLRNKDFVTSIFLKRWTWPHLLLEGCPLAITPKYMSCMLCLSSCLAPMLGTTITERYRAQVLLIHGARNNGNASKLAWGSDLSIGWGLEVHLPLTDISVWSSQ